MLNLKTYAFKNAIVENEEGQFRVLYLHQDHLFMIPRYMDVKEAWNSDVTLLKISNLAQLDMLSTSSVVIVDAVRFAKEIAEMSEWVAELNEEEVIYNGKRPREE